MKKIIRLAESDLNRIVRKVINEQSLERKPFSSSPNQTGPGGKPSPTPNQIGSTGNNQYGPYCRIGQSKGIIKQHTVGTGGPNVSFGETGFGLFDDSGKLICKISTKYTTGGYVATPSKK